MICHQIACELPTRILLRFLLTINKMYCKLLITMEEKQTHTGERNCNVYLIKKVADALQEDLLGNRDMKALVNSAILMFHLAAPELQFAFRHLYKRMAEGQITLEEAERLYGFSPSDENLSRALGRAARSPVADEPQPTPEPPAPRPAKRKS